MGVQDIYYFNKYKLKYIDMIDVILSYYLICKKRVEEYGFVDCLIVYYGSVVNFFFLESFFIYVFLVEGGFYFRM